jgi:hypothetical protein
VRALRLPSPRRRALLLLPLGLAVIAALAALVLWPGGSGNSGERPGASAAEHGQNPDSAGPPLKPHPQVVQINGVGSGQFGGASSGDVSAADAQGQSDAEVRAELTAFRRHLSETGPQEGEHGRVLASGQAVAPRNAPEVVKQVIQAGNEIARTPYKWGGGHGAWKDSGYDCSGSVSFALAGAGLLDRPLVATGFGRWGKQGVGKWITVYWNGQHSFMVVAGLRFDTSGARTHGTRWQAESRSTASFQANHPPGL